MKWTLTLGRRWEEHPSLSVVLGLVGLWTSRKWDYVTSEGVSLNYSFTRVLYLVIRGMSIPSASLLQSLTFDGFRLFHQDGLHLSLIPSWTLNFVLFPDLCGSEDVGSCHVLQLNNLNVLASMSKCSLHSRVRLIATPWTVAHQASLSMEFSRPGYWSGLPFPSPGDFPDQGSNPGLPHCRQILHCLSHQRCR